MRVRRLIDPVLTFSKRTGQRRKDVGSAPQKSGVGIGAVREEQASHVERRVIRSTIVHTRVARIEERLPPKRAPFRIHTLGVALDDRARGGDIARNCGAVDVGLGKLRMFGEETTRLRWIGSMPGAVIQAGQPDKDVDERPRIISRLWWIPDEWLDRSEILFQPGPACKSVGARRHELGITEREKTDRLLRARVKLFHLRDGGGVTGMKCLAQPLGFFPEMFEGRVVRQRTYRHSNLLARAWRADGLWSAASGEEVACLEMVVRSGGLGPSRGLEAPRAPTATLADPRGYVLRSSARRLEAGLAGRSRKYEIYAESMPGNIAIAGVGFLCVTGVESVAKTA